MTSTSAAGTCWCRRTTSPTAFRTSMPAFAGCRRPMRPGTRFEVRHTSREAKAVVKEVVYKLDINTLHRIEGDTGGDERHRPGPHRTATPLLITTTAATGPPGRSFWSTRHPVDGGGRWCTSDGSGRQLQVVPTGAVPLAPRFPCRRTGRRSSLRSLRHSRDTAVRHLRSCPAGVSHFVVDTPVSWSRLERHASFAVTAGPVVRHVHAQVRQGVGVVLCRGARECGEVLRLFLKGRAHRNGVEVGLRRAGGQPKIKANARGFVMCMSRIRGGGLGGCVSGFR